VKSSTLTEFRGPPKSSEDLYESRPLCKSHKSLVNPNELLKSQQKGDEIFIFDDDKIAQRIEIDVCDFPEEKCSEIKLLGVITKCRQKYLNMEIKVYELGTYQFRKENFQIPSFCECAFLNKV
jgi:hypothetical protein